MKIFEINVRFLGNDYHYSSNYQVNLPRLGKTAIYLTDCKKIKLILTNKLRAGKKVTSLMGIGYYQSIETVIIRIEDSSYGWSSYKEKAVIKRYEKELFSVFPVSYHEVMLLIKELHSLMNSHEEPIYIADESKIFRKINGNKVEDGHITYIEYEIDS